MEIESADKSLTEILTRDLMRQYGAVVSKADLRLLLGYVSEAAFKQALWRKHVPVPIFTIPNQRGQHALVRDIAACLVALRNKGMVTQSPAVAALIHQAERTTELNKGEE